jgi:isopropylmalate/homocitrate/citramalate synthase
VEGGAKLSEAGFLTSMGSVSPEVAKTFAKPKIYDVTLRDGEQQAGIAFTDDDKVSLFQQLDALGVDVVETGMVAVAANEVKVVQRAREVRRNALIYVLCRSMASDVELASEAGADGATVEIIANPVVAERVMGWGPADALTKSTTAVTEARRLGLAVNLFLVDATRTPAEQLADFAERVVAGGAVQTITIADTFGVADPAAITRYVDAMRVRANLPVYVHCHNDYGLGVANTLAGLEAGAFGFHASINGIGERAGNAALEDVVLALEGLYGTRTGIDLAAIRALSGEVAKRSHHPTAANKSVVGPTLFDIESGIAATFFETLRDSDLRYFYGYLPSVLGVEVLVLLGKGAGAANVRLKLRELGRDDLVSRAPELVSVVKEAAIAKGGLVTDDEFRELIRGWEVDRA